jgi:hypothetical protein
VRRTLFSLSLAAVSVLAQFEPQGPSATFLTIIPDARTAALGAAGVALDSLDANTYYNPANITSGPPMAATWTHDHWLGGDMSIDHAGVAYRPNGRLGFVANVQYFQISFASTDERGRFIGTTRWYDVAPSVSAAYRLHPAISAGLTVKAIYQRIAWSGGRVLDFLTSACDAGVQYRPLDALTLGLAVANLGPIIGYHTAAGYYLPRRARLGFAVRPPIPGPVSATVTGELSRDLFPAVEGRDLYHWGAGMELKFAQLAFVRLGYLHYDRDGRRGFTWGVGIERRGVRLDVGVDSDFYQEPVTKNVRFQFSWHL